MQTGGGRMVKIGQGIAKFRLDLFFHLVHFVAMNDGVSLSPGTGGRWESFFNDAELSAREQISLP